ncbi:MAG: sulfite exporter TauE/SafE family protein [Candidatus Poribacteria bacterium]|nr:sulfite exporter TauE/SafE family protein [Candidatus Poribacteria bacterium]
MTVTDLLFYASVYGIFLGSAFLQGLTGFGFGMVSMALLPFVMPAYDASILGALLVLFNTAYLTWRQRHSVEWKTVLTTFAFAMVGVPLGVYVLVVFDETLLKRLIGGAILSYVAYYLWRARYGSEVARGLSPYWRAPVGLLAGVLGGAVNVAGPPIIFYLFSQPWKPERIRASLVAFFWLLTTTKLILLFSRQMVPSSMFVFLPIIVVVWFGSRFGLWVSRRISPELFRRAVIASLVVLGILLIKG